MLDIVTGHEAAVRSAAFLLVFAAVAGWEALVPRRSRRFRRMERWPHNLDCRHSMHCSCAWWRGVAVGVAVAGEAHGWGLLNALALPVWIEMVAPYFCSTWPSISSMSVSRGTCAVAPPSRAPRRYGLRRDHCNPIPPDRDWLVHGIKCRRWPRSVHQRSPSCVRGSAQRDSHVQSRQRAPAAATDRWLRWLVVTPDMHRVHHSIVPRETNSNFGFNLPYWDHLFGTYRAQPAMGMKR